MPEESPITNKWDEVEPVKLVPEEVVIYRGERGSSYNHLPEIAKDNGRLYACWTNGVRHENDAGQRSVLSVSDDDGDTWSHPEPLADTYSEKGDYNAVSSRGIRAHHERLIHYYVAWEYTDSGMARYHDGGLSGMDKEGVSYGTGDAEGAQYHKNVRTEIITSHDGGEIWSPSTEIIENFRPNFCPKEIESGRLIIPGHLCYPYTDDPVGMAGWQMTGIPRLPEGYVDDHEGFFEAISHRGDERVYNEGSFYQTDDGVIHMMLRIEGSPNLLAVTESDDDGETWSEPMLTDYTDSGSRPCFGSLSDGRYYGLNTPEPDGERTPLISDVRGNTGGTFSDRSPLVLAISEDGVEFDEPYVLGDEPATEPRYPGMYKFGRYGYPGTYIDDETMYVVYSIGKENIGFKKVDLSEL